MGVRLAAERRTGHIPGPVRPAAFHQDSGRPRYGLAAGIAARGVWLPCASLHKPLCLLLQRLGRGSALFHQHGILLGDLVHQARALLHPLDAGGDKALDLLGRFGAALCKAAHLRCHHCETAALFATALAPSAS